uniref:Uncharacterized protein n=1 Tax=viral metagenome TaxID=1070528 RepID=A0A6M3JEI7_9ZZZZ
MKTKEFPKTIYVHVDYDRKEPFLIADYDIEGLDNGVKVGIYELKQVKKMMVTEELK